MAKLSTVHYEDFSGGLNDSASSRQIQRNEASLIKNWDITKRGQLTRRDGLTQKGDTQAGAISGLHAYLQTTGTKDILITEDVSLSYLNGSSFAELDTGFTAGNDFTFANDPINNRVYLCNEDNTLHYWDRASTTLNSCLTDAGVAVPHGNVLRWHKNHMFTCNNVTVSGTAYPNRLYWSAMGDADTWDTTNDFINVPGNGPLITMVDLGDALMLFKERGIQYLEGWGDTDWRITASASNVANLDEQVGTVSPKGAVRVGNEVWFMDEEANIRRVNRTDFDAFRRDIVSSKIKSTLATINKSYLSIVSAWTHDDKVYFSVPTGSSTVNDTVLVFDLIAAKRTGEEAWTTYTGWSIDFFMSYPVNDVYMLHMADGAGKKVYQHTGKDDDGTAINAQWDGKRDFLNSVERWKRFKFGYIYGIGDGGSDIGIYASVDGSTFGDMGDLVLASTGSALGPTGTDTLGPTGSFKTGGSTETSFKFYYQNSGAGVRGKWLQHSIRHNAAAEQPKVYGFTSHYKLRSLR